ncbi:MAG: hypothetical protein CVV24_15465 [Ignavibacteriae bacterium HGW-Ignavibacteriae-3]|nr:MAG: hypothetical protein CVV24_15465 [Ignavibacteriae bacterium HGW-Ignavibacteriae-3]
MGEDNYITYEDIPLSENYVRQVEAAGIKIANKLKWFNAVSAYLNDEQLIQIRNLEFVEKVEPVRISESIIDRENLNVSDPVSENLSLPKNTSQTSLNYGPSLTQAALSEIPAVHDMGIKGTGVIIGILDTGFRWKSHPSLSNRFVLNEKDFVQNDNITENQVGDAPGQDSHGTAVFSLMAGYASGSLIGPAYDASFILAKTEYVPTETHAEEDNYAAALEWMEGLGVQITSSSLGYANDFTDGSDYKFSDMNGKTTIVAKAANLAFDRGVSTFTAAGNERNGVWKQIISPADAFNIIAVGSVTSSNAISSFSSPGPSFDGRIKPEVVAMGSNDYHAVAGSLYGTGSGTSYATPIAAGIAGLLKSAWPHLTNVQIRKIFLESGDNTTSPNNDRGWGLISAKKAVSYPNLSLTNNAYKINKLFINANGVNQSSVMLTYKIGNGTFQSTSMSFDGTMKYNFQLPNSVNGTSVEFYFTYQTTNGSSVREPSGSLNYKFQYGNMLISGVESANDKFEIPTEFNLSQNYPNPFNPSTVISYNLSLPAKVTLKVFDLLGNEVATLVDDYQAAGSYNSKFPPGRAGSISNFQLSSGVYFYVLRANDYTASKKMILIK